MKLTKKPKKIIVELTIEEAESLYADMTCAIYVAGTTDHDLCYYPVTEDLIKELEHAKP